MHRTVDWLRHCFFSFLHNFLTDELPLSMSQVVVESALCALSLRLTRAIREQFQISLPILKVYACKISNWLHQFISYFAHHTPCRHRGGGGGRWRAVCTMRRPFATYFNLKLLQTMASAPLHRCTSQTASKSESHIWWADRQMQNLQLDVVAMCDAWTWTCATMINNCLSVSVCVCQRIIHSIPVFNWNSQSSRVNRWSCQSLWNAISQHKQNEFQWFGELTIGNAIEGERRHIYCWI